MFKQTLSLLIITTMSLVLSACSGSQISGLGKQFLPINEAHLLSVDQRSMYAGSSIIRQGGNAVDATIAMIIQAQVSHPERMSLNQGGLCLGYEGSTATPFALDYSTEGFSQWSGLLGLHARFGKLPFSALIQPALRDGQNPRLSQALVVWAEHPQTYAQLDPFVQSAQPSRWLQKPALNTPIGINIDDEIIITIDHPSQRRLVAQNALVFPPPPMPPIVAGGLDRHGLGITCVTNPMPPQPLVNSDNWVAGPLQTESPLSSSFQYAMPLLAMDYNANNTKLKWVGIFSDKIPVQTILENHQLLRNNAQNNLSDNVGYMLSYCPVGLPRTSSLDEVSCASFSGDITALGWVSRQ